MSAGETAVNCGAAALNGQNMGSDEAYNFVFKGEYMCSCLIDFLSRYISKKFKGCHFIILLCP